MQSRKPRSCGADAPKPAGPCRCGADAPKPAGPCSYGGTQTLNDIPLYAVPEAAKLRGRSTIALDCSILKIGVVSCCICLDLLLPLVATCHGNLGADGAYFFTLPPAMQFDVRATWGLVALTSGGSFFTGGAGNLT